MSDAIAQDTPWLRDSSAISQGLSSIPWGSVRVERLGYDACARIQAHDDDPLDSDDSELFAPIRSYSVVRDIGSGRALAIVRTSGDRRMFGERIVAALAKGVETFVRLHGIDSLEGARPDRILFSEPRTALFRLTGTLLDRARAVIGAKDAGLLEDESRLDAIGRRVTGSDDGFFTRLLLARVASTGRWSHERFIAALEQHYGRSFDELRSAHMTALDSAHALGRSIVVRQVIIPDSLFLAFRSDDTELRLLGLIGTHEATWKTYSPKEILTFEVHPDRSRLDTLGIGEAIHSALAAAAARASSARRPYHDWSRYTFPYYVAEAMASATQDELVYCACTDVWDAARESSIASDD